MSVAIVHDYLNQPGGAERVVLEMSRMWPDAPILTSLFRPRSTWPEFRDRDVQTSFLDRLPIDRRFRLLLPLYPAAMASLGTLDQDLVVSSTSGWAHGVRTSPETLHVAYCYAPARWLYGDAYVTRAATRRALAPLLAGLRAWDQRAARRPDAFITIADNVRRRVQSAYGIDSEVVYPPVALDRFRPTPRGDRLLVVSRLLDYKRVDLIVAAANQARLPLDVVGTGPSMAGLRQMAGPTVTFHGRLADEEVTQLMEDCDAVCFPGQEDFGIVPVEANAAGKPVVAFAAGGALETLEDGRTGSLFREPTVEAVLGAIRRVRALDTSPGDLARSAERFSASSFRRNLSAAISRAGDRRHGLVPAVPESATAHRRARRSVHAQD